MEYFKKVSVDELLDLSTAEKIEISDKVIQALKGSMTEAISTTELGHKLEVFIENTTTSVFLSAIEEIELQDIFNANRTFVVEKFLKKIRHLLTVQPPNKNKNTYRAQKENTSIKYTTNTTANLSQPPEIPLHPEEKQRLLQYITKIEQMILMNVSKSFKSKGTNHVIREILKIDQDNIDNSYDLDVSQLKRVFQETEIQYFINDPTRINTYITYLEGLDTKEQRPEIHRVIEALETDMLESYQGFLYEKVCELGTEEELKKVYEKIKDQLVDLSKSTTGNYFIQKFISVYSPKETFTLLKDHLGIYPENSNILFSLALRAAQTGEIEIVEYMIESIYMREALMKRLIFNENGGFDSKKHRLAIALLSVRTKYLRELQLETISLYSKTWLFNKVGLQIVTALVNSNLDPAVQAVFLGTMTKEFIGLNKTRAGQEFLETLANLGDHSLRKTINTIRRTYQTKDTSRASYQNRKRDNWQSERGIEREKREKENAFKRPKR
ncbi:hypothetical protein NEOKW01_1580 [Nematocida sp. AWRm80]|nr:hypothetical protein NEOKW01_1580 [Nematocida sp. AWRm80]